MQEDQVGLPLALGTATTAAMIVALVAVAALTGYYVQSYTLLFLLPVGGGLAGAGCGAGVFAALLWTGRKSSAIHYRLGAVLGLLGFVGTYVVLYLSAYVTPDLTINHTFT